LKWCYKKTWSEIGSVIPDRSLTEMEPWTICIVGQYSHKYLK